MAEDHCKDQSGEKLAIAGLRMQSRICRRLCCRQSENVIKDDFGNGSNVTKRLRQWIKRDQTANAKHDLIKIQMLWRIGCGHARVQSGRNGRVGQDGLHTRNPGSERAGFGQLEAGSKPARAIRSRPSASFRVFQANVSRC